MTAPIILWYVNDKQMTETHEAKNRAAERSANIKQQRREKQQTVKVNLCVTQLQEGKAQHQGQYSLEDEAGEVVSGVAPEHHHHHI